jgi:hypothetical protein
MNFDCIWNQFLQSLPGRLLAATLITALWALIFGIIALIALIFPPASPGAWLFLMAALVVIVVSVYGINIWFALMDAFFACGGGAAVADAINTFTGGLIAQVTDCPSAQAARDRARQALDDAERAMHDQEDRVRRARERLRAAQTGQTVAAAAVVVAALIPFGWAVLAAAIASLAIATALAARYTSELGQEVSKLQQLAGAVAAAQANRAPAEAAVPSHCPADTSETPGGTIIGGTRPVTTVNVAVGF